MWRVWGRGEERRGEQSDEMDWIITIWCLHYTYITSRLYLRNNIPQPTPSSHTLQIIPRDSQCLDENYDRSPTSSWHSPTRCSFITSHHTSPGVAGKDHNVEMRMNVWMCEWVNGWMDGRCTVQRIHSAIQGLCVPETYLYASIGYLSTIPPSMF